MQTNKNSSNLSNPDEKGFTLVRTDIIQLWVWLEGSTPLDDQPLKSLSEDISYRIRETLDSAVNYMRHCKRTKLKTSDLNKAFQFCNIEKTYGYLNKQPFEYNIIEGSDYKEKALQNCFKTYLYELKDKKIDLKLPDEEEEKTAEEKDDLSNSKDIHAKWLIVNGDYIKSDKNDGFNLRNESDEMINSDQDIENEFIIKPLSDEYNKFYKMITSIVLLRYESQEEEEEDNMFEAVLNSLRTNLKLQPVLSHLIIFLSQTIQKLTCSSSNKTSISSKINLFYLQRCIDVLKHLILNKNVFLAPKGFFSKIISCLLFCILQNSTMISNQDGLFFRENASSVLVLFIKLYQRFSIDTVNYITKNFFMPHFNEKIENKTLFSLYGVVCLLANLGGQMIEDFYDTLNNLIVKLENEPNPFQIKREVLAICLKCFVIYYKWLVRKHAINKNDSDYSAKKIFQIYKEIYEQFGDSFTNQIKLKNRIYNKTSQIDELIHINSIKLREISFERNNVIDSAISTWFEKTEMKRLKKITINYGGSIKLEEKSESIAEAIKIATNPCNIIIAKRFPKQIESRISNLNTVFL